MLGETIWSEAAQSELLPRTGAQPSPLGLTSSSSAPQTSERGRQSQCLQRQHCWHLQTQQAACLARTVVRAARSCHAGLVLWPRVLQRSLASARDLVRATGQRYKLGISPTSHSPCAHCSHRCRASPHCPTRASALPAHPPLPGKHRVGLATPAHRACSEGATLGQTALLDTGLLL